MGGKVVKAVMLGRERQNKQASVVASVIVDRVIGLYVLFVVATAAILATGFWPAEIDNIDHICKLVFLVTTTG